MFPDVWLFLILGSIMSLYAVGWYVWPNFLVALLARRRLAAGWEIREIRMLTIAYVLTILAFVILLFASSWIWPAVMLLVAGAIAWGAHRWDALLHLAKFILWCWFLYVLLEIISIMLGPGLA